MQRLEVSGAVRPIYGSLGVKRLRKGEEKCNRDARRPALNQNVLYYINNSVPPNPT